MFSLTKHSTARASALASRGEARLRQNAPLTDEGTQSMTEKKTLRKFWGWGDVGQGLDADEQEALRQRYAAGYGVEMRGPARAARRGDPAARAAARNRPRACARSPPPTPGSGWCTPTGARIPTSCAIFHRQVPEPPDVDRVPRDRSAGGRAARLGRFRRRRGDSVRPRLERRRRRRAGGGRQLPRLDHHRPRANEQGARGGPREPRRAHPGRRARPRARSAAQAARLHAAPLPAELRALDARRLDRDALGRPLRDALHPHRRLRRVDAHGDAARRDGDAAAAGLGRRSEPRPTGDRLRGHPRHPHRSLDATAGRAALSRLARGAVRLDDGGRCGGTRADAGRALPGELPAARRRGSRLGGSRATARMRPWSSASSRPTIRSTPG